jgi:hypothetical protein
MEKMLKIPHKTMKLILHKNKAAQFILNRVIIVPITKVMVSFNQNFQFKACSV